MLFSCLCDVDESKINVEPSLLSFSAKSSHSMSFSFKSVFPQEVSVNLDPVVLEVLQEARWMTKLEVSVPKVILKMSSREAEIKALHRR